MSESRKTRFMGSGFGIGVALGIIVGLVLGGNNTFKIIITGQGSVGCANAGETCSRKPYRMDPDRPGNGEGS